MITQILHVNFSSLTVPHLISVVQGDTGRNLKCIVDDFTLDGAWTATWYVERPSDVPVYNTATIETSDNSVNLELTAQSINEVGDNKLQVRILDADDQVVTSFACILSVKPFGGIGAVESSTEANIFDRAVEQAITNLQTQAEEVAEGVIESIPEDYTALTEEVNDVNRAITQSLEIYVDLRPTLTSGYINASTNEIVSSDNFGITAPVPVKKGQIVKLTATGYGTSIGMIATCDEHNTTRTTVVASIDNDEHTYTYSVSEDGYIVCSVKTLYGTDYTLSLQINYYGMIEETKTLADLLQLVYAGTINQQITKYINGYYVRSDGSLNEASTMFVSQSIDLCKGQILTFNARGYNQTVAVISKYDSQNDTYTPLVVSTDSTDRTYTYTATENITVRCSAVFYSSGSNVPYSATITTPDTALITIKNIETQINDMVTSTVQYPQMFTNIICMGDSLTKGYDGSGDTPLTTNYPFYIKKLMQAEVTNQSQGGINAKDFWSTYADDYDYTPYDCAIIFLGTNDGLTDTVDTDCHIDYTQNADTQTGAYGKIIGRIKSTAPNCKIFVVAGVNDYVRRATTMNPAVRSLAEFYSVGLIDVEDCIMSDSGSGSSAERYLYRPIDGIHYNRLGYLTLANLMYDSMSTFILEHLSMYA